MKSVPPPAPPAIAATGTPFIVPGTEPPELEDEPVPPEDPLDEPVFVAVAAAPPPAFVVAAAPPAFVAITEAVTPAGVTSPLPAEQ